MGRWELVDCGQACAYLGFRRTCTYVRWDVLCYYPHLRR